jgi:hypothetical protein
MLPDLLPSAGAGANVLTVEPAPSSVRPGPFLHSRHHHSRAPEILDPGTSGGRGRARDRADPHGRERRGEKVAACQDGTEVAGAEGSYSPGVRCSGGSGVLLRTSLASSTSNPDCSSCWITRSASSRRASSGACSRRSRRRRSRLRDRAKPIENTSWARNERWSMTGIVLVSFCPCSPLPQRSVNGA